MLSAMLFVLRTGVPWRDLPALRPWRSVDTRDRRWWCDGGLFARMLTILTTDAEGELRHWTAPHFKWHQHGANPGRPGRAAMGQNQGGLNTKLSAVRRREVGSWRSVRPRPTARPARRASGVGLRAHRRVVAEQGL